MSDARLPIPEASDLEIAFPANPHIPEWDEIPEEFRDNWNTNAFCQAAESLFFKGGSLGDFGLTVRDDLDPNNVYRALKVALGSFAPKHEHKIAAVGYMLSEWCEKKEKP